MRALLSIAVLVAAAGCVSPKPLNGESEANLKPPGSRVGAFVYSRPYEPKETLVLAQMKCEEIARAAGFQFAYSDQAFEHEKKTERWWLYCKIYDRDDADKPILTTWLYQAEEGGRFVWRQYQEGVNPDLATNNP